MSSTPVEVAAVPTLRTGRGVRMAVVDSGIYAAHPHVGGIAGGTPNPVDRIGHGTAVAAAIREKAPEVELYAVKVFDRTLSTTADRLEWAIYWAVEAGAHVVNLSLGTDRYRHAERLGEAVRYANEHGVVVVAAEESDGVRWLPGSLPGVVPVRLDWNCPRDEYRVAVLEDGPRFLASGYARPIPGVPLEANLKGISFAVANMSGFVARALQGLESRTLSDLLQNLTSLTAVLGDAEFGDNATLRSAPQPTRAAGPGGGPVSC